MPPTRGGGPRTKGLQPRGLDVTPAALAHKLPRVVGCISCSRPFQQRAPGQRCISSHRQYCGCCVYQSPRRSVLSSPVASRPSPLHLESEESKVSMCHSYLRVAQYSGRHAFTSSAPRRVATPPPVGSDDLEKFWESADRSVCISRDNPLLPVLFID